MIDAHFMVYGTKSQLCNSYIFNGYSLIKTWDAALNNNYTFFKLRFNSTVYLYTSIGVSSSIQGSTVDAW